MTRRWIAFILMLALSTASSAFAQGAEQAPLKLSLRQAIALAVSNNLDIRLAELDRSISKTRNTAALSGFDPILTLDAHYELDEAENTSTVLGSRQTETTLDVELEKKFLTGTTLNGSLTNSRTSTNSAFSALDPAFRTGWEVGITQAIAKNAAGIIDRAKVAITRLEVQQEDLDAVDRIESSVATTAKAYWEVVKTREQARLRKAALERAQALHRANQEKLELGLIEEPERLASEASVHLRREELTVARTHEHLALREFRLLLSDRSEVPIEPTEELRFVERSVEFRQSLKQALGHRRDYRQRKLAIEAKRLNLKMTANDLFPSVDLVASFRANGLDQKYAKSFNEISNLENPTYFVGLKTTWTLGDRAARSSHTKAQHEKAKALVELASVEQTMLRDVDGAVRELLRWEEAVRARQAVEEIYRRRLVLEERRFEYGRSNIQNLIDFQEDLIGAEQAAVEAVVAHHQAWIDLKRAEHTLLEIYGLSGDSSAGVKLS